MFFVQFVTCPLFSHKTEVSFLVFWVREIHFSLITKIVNFDTDEKLTNNFSETPQSFPRNRVSWKMEETKKDDEKKVEIKVKIVNIMEENRTMVYPKLYNTMEEMLQEHLMV